MSEDSNANRNIPDLWAWKRGRNPYLHNVFALLGIDPDGSEKSFTRALQRWTKKVETTHDTKFGIEISREELSRATQISRNEKEYVAERLLAHTVHLLETDDFKEEMQHIENLTLPKPADLLPLAVRDLRVLAERLPEVDSDLRGEGDAIPFPADEVLEMLLPSAEEELFGSV